MSSFESFLLQLLMQCHDPSQTIVQLDAPKGAQLEHKSTFSGQVSK